MDQRPRRDHLLVEHKRRIDDACHPLLASQRLGAVEGCRLHVESCRANPGCFVVVFQKLCFSDVPKEKSHKELSLVISEAIQLDC